jgi:glycosyltransferase involved in cell wall biosynthesis
VVSALIASKRVEVGIDAVSRIPDARLVVAGDGPLREEIEAKAARHLPGRFTRLAVAPDQMPLLYRSADVFLHLSEEEPFGNVFLEAMACGLPIVGHDTPRLRWIVGDDQFLVDTSNSAAIAENIGCAGKASSASAADRSARALNFSWSRIGKMYQEFLQEIVDAFRHRTLRDGTSFQA